MLELFATYQSYNWVNASKKKISTLLKYDDIIIQLSKRKFHINFQFVSGIKNHLNKEKHIVIIIVPLIFIKLI